MDQVRLNALQRRLESIYEVGLEHDVSDFLITDRELARALDLSVDARETHEKLLVHQDGDDLNLALYLAEEVIDKLRNDDPMRSLHNENLVPFCLALEGVSHFVYLAWHAERARSVTLMEMELQAEVDKYISIGALLTEQGQRYLEKPLRTWLFDQVEFDVRLNNEQLDRYRNANYYASKYCAWLANKYSEERHRQEMLNELRRFYRQTQTQKIRRIARTY